MRLAITPTALLLTNFASVYDSIDWILLILFSLPYPSKPDVMCLKSSCKDLVATTIPILSHKFLMGVTAALNCLTRNLILVKILVTSFSNPLGLLILRYVKSSWRIEYTTSGPTYKHMVLSFSYMTFGSSLSIILLNKSLLTPLCIISVAILIAIWSSFLL